MRTMLAQCELSQHHLGPIPALSPPDGERCCRGLNKNGPIGSYSLMFSHQGMELFEKLRRSRRCGLVAGSMSLWVTHLRVQKPMPGLGSLSTDQDVDPHHDDKRLNLKP